MNCHPRSGARICQGCGRLIGGDLAVCPYCNKRQAGSGWRSWLDLDATGDPARPVRLLIAANVVMFILSILIDPRLSSFSPFEFLAPTNQSLLVLGSTGSLPLWQMGRWWSLVAAGFLHGGLLHLLFNMLALRQLAPLMLREFGIERTIVIYSLGSIGGFLVSALAGVKLTIGASAAICSLIGALLYYGKSRGGTYGQAVFSQIGGWAMGIALFGFLFPGINNWGHGGGMAMGALLAWLLGYREVRRETATQRLAARICIIATALVLAWSALNGLAFFVLT
jgi:rhomboid protease GluP